MGAGKRADDVIAVRQQPERSGQVMDPRFLRLTARFNVRGGIYTTVVVERRQASWKPPVPVTLP